MQTYAARAGKPIRQIDEGAVSALSAHHWPGNIRQLENAIERAVVLAEGPIISLNDLPEEVRGRAAGRSASPEPRGDGDAGRSPLRKQVNDVERRRLIEALEQADGNKSVAARRLDIPRSTLFSKLKKYGLQQ